MFWPNYYFYKKERDIIYSVWENKETIAPAGHMLGKDFTAAFICLVFFLTREPCRVVTTSVDETQLEGVLWGEIRNFINRARYPLDSRMGGPLVINHLHIRKIVEGKICGLSYLLGRVAEKGEGMSGHHIAATGDGIPRTLFVGDEVSGVDNNCIKKATEWCNRMLLIGNPYKCDNYFRTAVEGDLSRDPETNEVRDPGGDLPAPDGKSFIRKIIHISAEDSPNVRLAKAQIEAGLEPTNEIIVPGVLPYSEYLYRSKYWDIEKRTVGLAGKFYRGFSNLLYPDEWRALAMRAAESLRGHKRQGKGIGVDTGEGKANTTMTAVDELGIIEQVSKKTKDTSTIPWEVVAFGEKHKVPPSDWGFDLGGGGRQAADFLRSKGYPVRTIAFGGSIAAEPRRGLMPLMKRKQLIEDRHTFKNRRAQMYWGVRTEIDPIYESVFAIPAEYKELHRQMSLIPLTRGADGKVFVLPKNKPPGSTQQTLIDLLGASPDELDCLAIAIHVMYYQGETSSAGALF